VRQAVGASNHTVPIGLTACATTSGSAVFLTIPTDHCLTLNAVAATDLDAFVEFGGAGAERTGQQREGGHGARDKSVRHDLQDDG